MKNGVAFCMVLLAALASSVEAKAANCSNRNVLAIANEAVSLQRPISRCAAIVNRRSSNVAQMCRVCGPTFARLQRLERNLRKNKSCFAGDRKLVRAINDLSSVRYELQFLRRGCGY